MPHLEVRRLLEGGAYFNVDTQRCGAYLRKYGMFIAEVDSEPCETSKIKRFAEIVNGSQLIITFAKRSILDV